MEEHRTVTSCSSGWYGVPNKHFPNTNSLQHQTRVRTSWQKCPNRTSCSKDTVAQVAQRVDSVLEFISCPGACFPYTKEKRTLAVSVKQGRIREGSPNKRFWLQLGVSPRIFHLGPPSHKQLAHRNHLSPYFSHLLPWLYSENRREPNVVRTHTHTGCQRAVPQSGESGCLLLKANKEARLQKGTFALFPRPATGGWGRRGLTLVQRLTPCTDNQGAKVFINGRRGLHPGKNTGVGCHFLLQGIFPNQGSNPGLPHCRQTLYPLNHWGRP